MKQLTQYISEVLIKNVFELVKTQVKHKSESVKLQINKKRVDLNKLIDYIAKQLRKNQKVEIEHLLKDITEIIQKNDALFKKIAPVLRKWTAIQNKNGYYDYELLLKNNAVVEYIKTICKTLEDTYNIKGLSRTINNEDIEKDDEYLLYCMGFISIVLAIIAEDV